MVSEKNQLLNFIDYSFFIFYCFIDRVNLTDSIIVLEFKFNYLNEVAKESKSGCLRIMDASLCSSFDCKSQQGHIDRLFLFITCFDESEDKKYSLINKLYHQE